MEEQVTLSAKIPKSVWKQLTIIGVEKDLTIGEVVNEFLYQAVAKRINPNYKEVT